MKARNKKILAVLTMTTMLTGLFAGCGNSSTTSSENEVKQTTTETTTTETTVAETEKAADVDYPTRTINNVIPFAAGGGVDTWNRAVMAEMANIMGATITSSNMTGGSAGSVGVAYCWQAAHDAYTLCGTSETPLTIPVQTGAEQTSKDWKYFIAAGSPGILCVNKNCSAQTIEEVAQQLKDNPSSLSIAGTQGGLWFAQAKLFETYADMPFNWVAYDGSGTAIKGCFSGETDAVVASAGELNEYIKSGDLIPLAVMDKTDYAYPGLDITVPAVTTAVPALTDYLPLQQFLGFMVPADTDEAYVAILEDAFHQAMATDSIKSFAESNVATIFDLTGDEATAMAKEQESKLSWILYDMGQTKFSPEEFGIERP